MFVLSLPVVAAQAVHKLAGVDARTMLLFLPLVLAGLVPYILPIGYLLAIVVTYGRLAADHEWTAIRMAGIHPFVVVQPALLLAIVLSAANLWLVSEKLPELRRRERVYLVNVLRETIANLSPGRTGFHIGKFYLSAGYREGQDFLEALVYFPAREGHEAQSFIAERVHFQMVKDEMRIYLYNARSMSGDLDVRVSDPVISLPLDSFPRSPSTLFTAIRYLGSKQLSSDLANLLFDEDHSRHVAYAIHSRRAESTTYFMFLLLGIPTGLMMRRGTQLGALSIAVGFALVYFLLSMRLGKQMMENHLLSPVAGAWSINLLGTLCGALLMRKALRQ